MKNLLLTLSLTIPSLSFACIDLSGTYKFCKSDYLEDDPILSVTILQSTPKLNLALSTRYNEVSADYLLDGIARTETFELGGMPATMTTIANCLARDLNLDFTLEQNSELFKSGYNVTKDYLGRLVITETFDGEYLSQTTCEQVK